MFRFADGEDMTGLASPRFKMKKRLKGLFWFENHSVSIPAEIFAFLTDLVMRIVMTTARTVTIIA